MSRAKDRLVYMVSARHWAVRRIDSPYALSVHDTKRQAVRAAKRALKRDGGNNLHVSDRMGSPREEASCPTPDGSDPEGPRPPFECRREEQSLAGFFRSLLHL